jgi:hypothetical protein
MATATPDTVDFSSSSSTPKPHPSLTTGTSTFSARFAALCSFPSFVVAAGPALLVQVAEADERVRAWVDDVLVIDQWTSSLVGNVASTTFRTSSSADYDVRVEYKQGSAAYQATVSIVSAGVTYPLGVFGRTTSAAATSFFPVAVNAGQPNSLAVTGVTILTAGVQSVFTVSCYDGLSNVYGEWVNNLLAATDCNATAQFDYAPVRYLADMSTTSRVIRLTPSPQGFTTLYFQPIMRTTPPLKS